VGHGIRFDFDSARLRAESAPVLDALVQRGLPRERLAASGVGESRPIAPNDDESGRTLNRRVEVHCPG